MSKTGRSLGEGGPIEIRYRLAYDGKLLSDVLAVFLRVVRGWYYRKAKEAGKTGETSDDEDAAPRKYRLTWSALPARIFHIDMKCSHCGGKMKIVAAVTDPASIRHYLEGTGQPAEIPTLAPARAPPQDPYNRHTTEIPAGFRHRGPPEQAPPSPAALGPNQPETPHFKAKPPQKTFDREAQEGLCSTYA